MNLFLIISAILAIIIVSKLLHLKHLKHKIIAIFLILLIFFVIATFSSVTQSKEINLKSPAGIISATKVYFSWLAQGVSNTKNIVGNALNLDWAPNMLKPAKDTEKKSNNNETRQWIIP